MRHLGHTSADAPTDAGRRYILKGQELTAPPIPAGLHIVSTPIGNLGDITLRAIEVLAAADLIACEDTRVTRKLLEHYGVGTSLMTYHEHNAAEIRPKLLARMAAGAAIALVSDAGTPLVSDPGFKLVRAARDEGHIVTALPGPCAAIAALAIAGLPTDRFFFEGFLPAKAAQRDARIAELARIPATVVLYESGNRIADALGALLAGFGARDAAICRELTKLHEEVRRGSLAELAQAYAGDAETRGEFVIVVAPPPKMSAEPDLDALLRQAMTRLSVKEAVAEIAAVTGHSRRDIYQRALALKGRAMTDNRPAPERQVAFRLGLSAESRAAAYLIAKGFRIMARRFRSPAGEIDIVARRRHLLIFVEVKARDRLDDAAWSVTERQRARIIAAAEIWLARYPDDRIRDIRFDAMLVAPGCIPRHITAAFDASQ